MVVEQGRRTRPSGTRRPRCAGCGVRAGAAGCRGFGSRAGAAPTKAAEGRCSSRWPGREKQLKLRRCKMQEPEFVIKSILEAFEAEHKRDESRICPPLCPADANAPNGYQQLPGQQLPGAICDKTLVSCIDNCCPDIYSFCRREYLEKVINGAKMPLDDVANVVTKRRNWKPV